MNKLNCIAASVCLPSKFSSLSILGNSFISFFSFCIFSMIYCKSFTLCENLIYGIVSLATKTWYVGFSFSTSKIFANVIPTSSGESVNRCCKTKSSDLSNSINNFLQVSFFYHGFQLFLLLPRFLWANHSLPRVLTCHTIFLLISLYLLGVSLDS